MTQGIGNPAYERSIDDSVSDTDPPAKQNGTQNGALSHTDSLPNVEVKTTEAGDTMLCGYGSCRPSCLQTCNNPKVVLFVLSCFAFVQGFVVNGINNVNTTTIERRFNLPSSKVGLISSSYDIAAGLTVLPMTYYGTFGHNPRMLSGAAFVMSLGSFVMALPHFTTSLYDYGGGVLDTCDVYGNSTTCDSSSSSGLSNYLYVFILGQLLHGFGGSVLYTTGYVYIDSNVKIKNSPFYQGIMICCSTVGPAVGYLLGGFFLNTYVDFHATDTDALRITPEDSRWVGAWWLGFLFSGSLLLLIVVAIYPFPKLTPAGHRALCERKSQAHQNGGEEIAKRDDFLKSWKDLPMALKILLSNPVFMFTSCANVSETMLAAGFATFLPKIIQNQFSQTASWAALLAGFVAIPGTALGNLLGGGIMKGMKLKVRGMLRLCILVCVLAAIFAAAAFIQCPLPPFAGVTVPYSQSNSTFEIGELNSTCNANCGCSQEIYQPVCGSDGVQYFNPCHAGCVTQNTTSEIYAQCACIAVTSAEATAADLPCETSCGRMAIFLPIFVIVILFTFMAGVPGLNVTLRSIPDKQRSLGLGVNAVLFRFLGTFPGPLFFGAIFDGACLVWQETCSGETGSCWVYDNAGLARNLFLLAFCLKMMSTLSFSLAYCTYKPPPDEDDEEAKPTENPPSGPEGEANLGLEMTSADVAVSTHM